MSDSLLMVVALIPSMLFIGVSLCWMMLGFPLPDRSMRTHHHWFLGDPPHQHRWSNNMANVTGIQTVTYTCSACGATKRERVSVVMG